MLPTRAAMILAVSAALGSLSCPSRVEAGVPAEQLLLALPGSIFMDLGDPDHIDRDRDGLKDDMENMLAEAWRPHFVFDEEETDRRANEPVVLFQVRPEDWSGPYKVTVRWAFLFARDGGYPGVCTDAHDGDSQRGESFLESDDGIVWRLARLNLWDRTEPATSARIEWTGPRQTYWKQLPDRPSPKVYVSEGKHHQYQSAGACEDAAGSCEEDCGGGAKRYANLTPKGAFTNVGEPNHHPDDAGENVPFVNKLAPFGYKDEYVWFARWRCQCDDGPYADCFTGGAGAKWSTSWNKCTRPAPVYSLFLSGDPSPQPLRTRKRLISVVASY